MSSSYDDIVKKITEKTLKVGILGLGYVGLPLAVTFALKDTRVLGFEKNPEKYATALANSYSYQTKCPVMGGAINPKAAIQLADGRKIYFCCPGC